MGSRNDNIVEDTHADQVLRRLLQHTPERLTRVQSPDLVERTLARLPAAPPLDIARRQAARRQWRLLLGLAVVLLFGLVAVTNIWSTFAGRPHTTLIFGSGNAGASAMLLGVQLAVKPLWNSVRTIPSALIVVILLGASAGGFGLWRLVRQTRVTSVEDL